MWCPICRGIRGAKVGDFISISAIIHPTATFASGMKLTRTAEKVIHHEHKGFIKINSNCYIGPMSVIHRARPANKFTQIDEYVQIGSLNNIGHHAKIGKRTIITQGCLIGGSVEIGEGCFLAMGCIILPHVSIAPNTMIGAGAVVTKDITKEGVYYGNPAKYIRPWDGDF